MGKAIRRRPVLDYDPIVEEVRRIRDAHAAKFNYDLDAIFEDLKASEKARGLKTVNYPPKLIRPRRATALPS